MITSIRASKIRNTCSYYQASRNYSIATVSSLSTSSTTISTTSPPSSAINANANDNDNLSSSSPNLPIKVPILSTETHEIHSGVILSRPPLLTPKLHPFEKAFFFYQKRLNERLAVPFSRYFYFKKDTPANTDWKIKIKERGGVPAKELGPYNAYGKNAWNDELLVKEKHMVEPEYIINQLVKDARVSVTEDGVVVQDESTRIEGVEMPLPRTTEADLNKDLRRLDRLLDRTLYLVVKSKDTQLWGFPSGELLGKESLHKSAERILAESCGLNMNTWIVGHVPIAYHILPPLKRTIVNINDENKIKSPPIKNQAIFFMKGRIMAGQADLHDNYFNLDDFRWLTKEEVSNLVPSSLFSSVDNSMPER
ncbi:54S ribosomal protein L17, mitochondrial [Erysiphe neolycopersici]|uniref:Large ribosomal subunit protein mL46 n=1 Tax=Erysiphe neolycopersici TaxID=212602 RepID=A0A420I4Z3_9PEZI|nr:54S ribosomal protein L17, mitochondrial [Erysiphe neolycopersici]